ncbi:adenosylmethionine--8-amino-7-oxononanoate transaminase [Desulfobacterium sp. N47]
MKDINLLNKSELLENDKNHLWHPFTQMKEWAQTEPLIIVEGEGNYLIDIDGNRYLDGVSSLWANIHGHKRKEINQAISGQLQKISHTTLLGLTHPNAVILAQNISQIAPGNLKWVFYSESGSTAVEIALKMAFQYWQNSGKVKKTGFVCLGEGYHGDTIGAVSVGGIDLFHNIYSPLLFKSYKVPSPYLYCKKHNIPLDNGAEFCADEVKKLLEKHHEKIAAFIIEPLIQGAGGMLPFPPGYLNKVRQYCSQYDVLLIADEVAVGFGHTGTMFACEKENVEPDILCLGKGLTGGYLPLSATLASDKIFDAFWGDYDQLNSFFHGHTFTGNPLACAAALASLDIFGKDQTLKNLPAKINALKEGLDALSKLDFVGDVRQCGLMAGVEIFEDKSRQTPFPLKRRTGHKICLDVRNHGLILRNLGDVIVFMPPLSITCDEITHMIESLEKSIRKICK